MTTAARLLPCPFCGGTAEIERKGTARASMVIACDHCGARMESGDVYGLTRPDQWCWNRRAPDPAKDKALAAAEEALEDIARGYDGHQSYSGTNCADIARTTLVTIRAATTEEKTE